MSEEFNSQPRIIYLGSILILSSHLLIGIPSTNIPYVSLSLAFRSLTEYPTVSVSTSSYMVCLSVGRLNLCWLSPAQ
jgi:hypothetical protein